MLHRQIGLPFHHIVETKIHSPEKNMNAQKLNSKSKYIANANNKQDKQKKQHFICKY